VIRDDVEDDAHAVGLHPPDEVLKTLLPPQLRIDDDGIDHIVPVIAAGRRFADGRQIVVGNPERLQIRDGGSRVAKGITTMQLKTVGGQRKCRLR
jgi:hypothetical protein